MTVRVYRHNDAGAPVLTGAIGGALAVLRACLVTGYGAKAGAGWTEPFSGTNKAVFQAGAGNQHLLRVDDTTTASFRVRGYASMSDVDTGADPTPTDTLLSGGGYMLKSNTTDATARPWLLVATEKAFHLWVGYGLTVAAGIEGSSAAQPMMFFGKITSYKTGDGYDTALICNNGAAATGAMFGRVETSFNTVSQGHYLMRSYTQIGGAVAACKYSNPASAQGGTTVGAASLGAAYPDPVTGGMLLSPLFLSEPSALVTRGVLPGAWAPLHPLPGAPGDTFSGSGALAGKTFILLDCANGSSRGRVALEISDTW